MHSHSSINFVYYQVVSHFNSSANEINKHIHSFIHLPMLKFNSCEINYYNPITIQKSRQVEDLKNDALDILATRALPLTRKK